MSTPLLQTKLYAPPARLDLVSRPRLVGQLNAGLHGKLTLISAPAGFGKTTVLSQWTAVCERRVAWISLDPGDNDPDRFWAYFAAALQKVPRLSDAGIGEAALAALQSPGVASTVTPLAIETLLTELINEISEASARLALVLDDFHVITSQQVNDALAFLLNNLPPSMHLVLSSRADPVWPLARLRARGEMTELRAQDLRFTPEEAAEFLNNSMQLDLTPEDIAALEARTEGWIAGLQMAALSMRRRRDVSGFIEAFTGSHRFILDYLIEEVLDQQSPDVQEFLLETSILERMTAPLCDAVRFGSAELPRRSPGATNLTANAGSGQHSSRSMLAALADANLFLVPLDDDRRWYRYHHLFADVLRSRLRQAHPTRWTELHSRAAQWFEHHGMFEEAVHYALAAQDYRFAARLIAQVSRKVLERESVSVVLRWFKALPQDLVFSHPTLLIDYAWVLAFSGYLDEVAPLLQAIEKALRGESSTPREALLVELLDNPDPMLSQTIGGTPTRSRFPIILDLLRACVERFRNPQKAKAYCDHALEEIPPEDVRDRCVALVFLGHSHLLNGDTSQAEQALLEAVTVGRTIGVHSVYLSAVNYLGHQFVLQGRLREAMSLVTQASRYVQEQPGPIPAGIERIRMGDIQREWNNLPEASENIREGLRMAEAGGDFVFMRDAYTARARLDQALGDTESAAFFLQRAEQITQHTETTQGVTAVKPMLTRLWIAMGNVTAAERWAEESGLDAEGELTFLNEYGLLTLVRLFVAQNRLDEASRLLERLLSFAKSAGRNGRVIEIQMLQALVLRAKGDMPQALSALGAALSIAEPEGYVRLFLDEGEPMRDLLRHAGSRGIAPQYVSGLLYEFGKASGGTPSVMQPLIEPLSERELEVLGLMASGLSNQAIGDELIVALGTVKAHAAAIYRKLDVNSRTQAVARARELGIIA